LFHLSYEDHCDYGAIDRLDRAAIMLIPSIFPNHVIESDLAEMGFSNIRMLPLGEPLDIAPGVVGEVVAPMNSWGTEVRRYDDDGIGPAAIDTGLILEDPTAKIVLLADNSPYRLADAGPSASRMQGADVICFPYNGFADDFPVCYDNFSTDEKRELSLSRCVNRAALIVDTLRSLKPGHIMPYSSDFLVCGPRAKEFVDIHAEEWADKSIVAERFADQVGCEGFAIYEDDIATVEKGAVSIERHAPAKPDAAKIAETLYSPAPNTKASFSPVHNPDALIADMKSAANHMFDYMDRLELSSEWIIEFDISDLAEHFWIDMGGRRTGRGPVAAGKTVRCRLDSGFLQAHIDLKVHWNNSMISYNLSWERHPNEYDAAIYKAINFLHKPKQTISASALGGADRIHPHQEVSGGKAV
jgi:hypothetical protein